LHWRREGHVVGKPARADDHRPGNARRHSQRLYAQGRKGERRALEHRVRDRGECQRPGQGGAEIACGGSLQREEFCMKAYAIAVEALKGQALCGACRRVVPEPLVPLGVQFMARGGTLFVLEVEWPHLRLVLAEFPTREAAEGWSRSAAYQKV